MTRNEHHQERRGRRHMIDTPMTDQALEEKIRRRAFELYELRDGGEGDPESDWYRAEAEIAPRSKQEH